MDTNNCDVCYYSCMQSIFARIRILLLARVVASTTRTNITSSKQTTTTLQKQYPYFLSMHSMHTYSRSTYTYFVLYACYIYMHTTRDVYYYYYAQRTLRARNRVEVSYLQVLQLVVCLLIVVLQRVCILSSIMHTLVAYAYSSQSLCILLASSSTSQYHMRTSRSSNTRSQCLVLECYA